MSHIPNHIHNDHYNKKLPFNSLPTSDNIILTPTASTPIRLNSPHIPISDLKINEPYNTASTPHSLVKSETSIPYEIESTRSPSYQPHPSLLPPQSSSSSISSMPVPSNSTPQLLHKWTHTHSILCVVSSNSLIYCGTQDGKILIYDISTYSLKGEIKILVDQQDQSISVLTLCLSDQGWLFAGCSDSLVRVYDDQYTCKYVIYSLVDIGDIYSLAWCEPENTLFIGAQNASILWCKLTDSDHNQVPNIENLPHFRYNKFFDSKGPGGIQNTLQTRHALMRKNSSRQTNNTPKLYNLIECNPSDIIRFAHNGYVYCLEFFHSPIGHFEESTYLISGGGDGIINIWNTDLEKLTSLENDESVLSMCIFDSLLYVGLGDSCINVWDLLTLQMVRTFQCDDDEVLSLGVYNDSLYKACAGLYKMSMKSTECIKLETEVINTIKFLSSDSKTYLIAGGNKSLSLWNITEDKEAEDSSIASNCKFSNDDLLIMLRRYISYKTISKYPELYLEDNRHCAQFLTRLFNNFGAYQTKLLPIKNGNPIVFAEFKKNTTTSSHLRVLWYAHYDVVDATRHEAKDWKTDPFKLIAKEGNLYARGVSDNKGPTLASIFTVGELYSKQQLNCDVVFIIEGEEECGSIGFQHVINQNKNLIGNIDYIILSNSYWLDDITPCLNYGLRGVINTSITIKSDKPDRHSGVDGGVSREPTMDMMHLLSSLTDSKSSRIQIDGFYDDVLPLSDYEKLLYIKIQNYLNCDINSLMKKWREPSLTIHKIQVSGPNNNTVIPQLVQATISIRTVPNQDLNTIKSSLIQKLQHEFDQLGSDNHLSINIFHEADAWLGDPSNKVYKLLYENLKKHWETEPLFIREGGSIPSIRFLEKCFNAPAAQIPCGQSSDNAHLKDEKLRIINLYKLRSILTDTLKSL